MDINENLDESTNSMELIEDDNAAEGIVPRLPPIIIKGSSPSIEPVSEDEIGGQAEERSDDFR